MKYKIKKCISLLLSLSLAIVGSVIPTVAAEPSVTSGQGNLFSSSFEYADGLTLLQNTADAGSSKNIIKENTSGVRGYVGDLTVSDSIKGSGDLGNEGMQTLFDGTADTKFLQVTNPSESTPVWVSFGLSEPKIITQYSICAGNDSQPRDPSDWTLSGSTDGTTWKVLDSREGETFYSRKQENIYSFENTAAYSYYKFNVTARRGTDACVQFSELRLGTGIGDIFDPSATDPNISGIAGNVNKYLVRSSINGTDDNGNESKYNLFDMSTSTKCFMGMRPTVINPAWVSFKINTPKVITTYAVGSANDFAERDPKSWTLYGSNDGNSWNLLDKKTAQSFKDRYTLNTYTIENSAAYEYYKLSITENNGADAAVQFSELQLGTGVAEETGSGEVFGDSNMVSKRTGGPAESWVNYTGIGWTGYNCLQVSGSHVGSGEAYGSNILYKDLNIPVTANTQLSYMIFPAISKANSYDFDYTSQYLAVDLLFDDGTYLSGLGAKDIYGNGMDPVSQGDSKTLAYMQWNQVIGNIGSVAAGKTIKKILVAYHKLSSIYETTAPFLTYFDDIVIETVTKQPKERLSDYVNIFRGSNSTSGFSRGLTSPTVLTPHGFNMVTPVTENKSSSHYRYQLAGNRNTICHFALTHIATAWGSSYGDWQFMPNTALSGTAVTSGSVISADKRRAEFSHDNETGHAHYYSVNFDEDSSAAGVKVEVTPTEHAMLVRFTFPKGSANRNIIFDDVFTNGKLTLNPDNKTFTVYTDHIGNDGGNRMFVYGEFDTAFSSSKIFDNKTGFLSFPEAANGDTVITMKVATSFMSQNQAKHNMDLEVAETDTFDSVFERARNTWDEQLGIIEIEGADEYEMETFYSSMYRLFSYPNTYSENIGTNENPNWKHANPKGPDLGNFGLKNPQICDGKLYVNNGFWDTYRTAWAAYAFLTPEKDAEMLNGLLSFYNDTGWIPRWTNPGGSDSMNGSHSEVILGDAAMRGVKFDLNTAYQASIKSANALALESEFQYGGRKEQATYPFNYFISNQVNNGFSWTMENYINDYGTSQLAAALGKTDEAAYLKNRSVSYTTMFNKAVGGFFTGKNTDGTFAANPGTFDPTDWWGDYTETNAWNFLFAVPQDGNGLANLFGGKKALGDRLDELFNADPSMNDDGGIHEMREVREVRMGMYGHSNQPSHAIPYLYNYAGQPYKTQETVREIFSRMYVGNSIGQGYYGDEDNGEQSAWYIFSALGFYPVSMGNPEYAIGSPLFTKATVHLENGKDLVISAPNNSDENIYIQSMKVNGKEYNKNYILHETLAAGGTIEFNMGNKPSSWGCAEDSVPTSITKDLNQPYAKTDLTSPNTEVSLGISSLTKPVIATKSTADGAKLFDNTSNTSAVLSGTGKNIIYFTPVKKTVTMYTVTSSGNPSKAPASFALYGSNDGSSWTELDSRSGQTFAWNQYVRPFAVAEEKQAAYSYYKLTFGDTSDIEVSEIEFIGGIQLTSGQYTVDGINKQIIMDADIDYTEFIANTSGIVSVTQDGANVTSGKLKTGMIVTDELGNLYTVKAGSALVGDVDLDGYVNVSDVVALRSLIMKGSSSSEQLYAGDFDGDKKLTVTDVVALRTKIMKGN